MNLSTKIQYNVFGLIFLGLYYKPCLIYMLFKFVVVTGMVVGLWQKNTNLMCKSKKLLNGKTVIVTGGTTGIGLEIATDLAHRHAKVIIACPFEHEGATAKKRIERSSGSDKVIFKNLDLGSFDSIHKFANDILKNEDRLDILVNNAGIGVTESFLTKDNLDVNMQINYFGACLLTLLLLPLLKKTGTPEEPSRIVNTASVLHKFGRIDLENWNKSDYWNKMVLYGNSKLCIVIFTKELSKRLKDTNVVVNVVDPGAVGTPIFQSPGKKLGVLLTFLIAILFKHPWEGAQTALYACLSDSAGRVSGKYFKNCKVTRVTKKEILDDNTSESVWKQTIDLINIKDHDWLDK